MSQSSIAKSMKYFAFGTQLVWSIIMPFVICIFIAVQLQKKMGFGSWVMWVAVILSLIISVIDCIHMGRIIIKQAQKDGSMANILLKNALPAKKSTAGDDTNGRVGIDVDSSPAQNHTHIVGDIPPGNTSPNNDRQHIPPDGDGDDDGVERLPNYFTQEAPKLQEDSKPDKEHVEQ